MEQKWWHKAIGYEIYPKSFQDSNGDGIGDLGGILARLDYLQELGINLIWICPINRSPMVDHGYDISDYEEIDEIFGSKAQFQELIQEAEKRGIKVIMDLVVNHSSDQHAWFQKALQDPQGEWGDYYYFQRGTQDSPPNDWYGIFNGSTWEKVGGADSDLYYLHIFTKEQPDLNWENPKLREEIYSMIRRWLDFGVAGFRVDAISHIKKNFQYQSPGSTRKDGLVSGMDYFNNVEGIETFLQELRENTFSHYDCFTVGEANTPTPTQLEQYAGEQGHFSSVFDFFHTPFHVTDENYAENPLAMVEALKEKMFHLQSILPADVFLTNITENHDNARSIDKFIPKELQNFYSASLLGSVNFFLRGIPFLYQGQELGMLNYPKDDISQYQDPTTWRQYQEKIDLGESPAEALAYYNRCSREHSRTPMQWTDQDQAGFTSGTPWFPVNPNHKHIHSQENSLLSYYKKMISLRKDPLYQDTWVYGSFQAYLPKQEGFVGYYRKYQEQTLLCLFQCCNQECTLPLTASKYLLGNYPSPQLLETSITLRPFEVLILQV